VVSLLTLLFQYINILFPDQLNYYYQGSLDSIRWASSILIIVWPVHIILAWLIGKDYAANPQKRELWVRRWLVYLTLFFTAITIIIDLVTLVYRFYGGDLTTPFALKVLAVLIVAGAVFGYFIWDLRRSLPAASKTPKTLAWIVSAILLVVIISGFFVIGSPSKQRAMKFDEQRVADLQAIQSEIINHWIKKGTIPVSLTELTNNISGFTAPLDPQTKAAYEYRGLSSLSFELCASFQTESPSGNDMKSRTPMYYPYGTSDNWQHNTGRQCFTRNIDPLLYKPEPLK
ncbi:MAG: DUF5671 domain-containing protein, partial [Patescibacteria group bacterium]